MYKIRNLKSDIQPVSESQYQSRRNGLTAQKAAIIKVKCHKEKSDPSMLHREQSLTELGQAGWRLVWGGVCYVMDFTFSSLYYIL